MGEVAKVKTSTGTYKATSTGTYKAAVVASGKHVNMMGLCIFVGCY